MGRSSICVDCKRQADILASGSVRASMASFYLSTVEHLLSQSPEILLAQLSTAYAHRGYTSQYTDQTLSWQRDLQSLRQVLSECAERSQNARAWGVILEFSIPRKEKRIDIVLLVRDTIVIVEAKSGDTGSAAKQQIETYAILLHYFHKGSANRRIVPVLVSPRAAAPDFVALNQTEFFPQMPSYWIAPVMSCSWENLSALLLNIESHAGEQIAERQWESSPYFPVPSIIDAATALSSGLSIREIAHSEASEHEIEEVGKTIQGYMESARRERLHAICFLTGVPGSGKTFSRSQHGTFAREQREPYSLHEWEWTTREGIATPLHAREYAQGDTFDRGKRTRSNAYRECSCLRSNLY